METGQLGGLLLREIAFGPELSKSETESALCALDRSLERRAESNLGRSVISRESPANGHAVEVAESSLDLHKSCLESNADRA